MVGIESTPDFVSASYERSRGNLNIVRSRTNRPLTLTEKILYGHLADPERQDLIAGESYLLLRPDRIAMQDATAQMALLQFMLAGKDRVAVPTTVHCDHLIQARVGAKQDVAAAENENNEVYAFLESVTQRYGAGFWKPNSGIIHQVVLENYAFPGGMMIGTDSHTPNAGGLGMFASGVGGADAVDVLADFPWEVLHPKVVGVKLTGAPNGWTAPKDVILYLCGLLTVAGGTNRVIEYFGPGTENISCTGKATICNMGAELGATCSIFPYDQRMGSYLKATERSDLATVADANGDLLKADERTAMDPEKYYDLVVEVDLSMLEPHIVGPHTPDLARPVSQLAKEVSKEGYPDNISAALVGSCTNSSYEDIARTTDVAEQARKHGAKVKTSFLVTPGSEQVHATIERDGQMSVLEAVDATVLANACGPCIGQWKRSDITPGEPNSIVSSFNRNFPKRNDGNAETMSFIASPEIVMAYALAGSLSFNPLSDALQGTHGPFKLQPPAPAPEVPDKGFVRDTEGFVPPLATGASTEVIVSPESDRLQLLTPFPAWDGKDFEHLPVILKAKGKCTTDHISPAGPWLSYRGHLDKISGNAFLGAVNAFTGETGMGRHPLTGETNVPYPKLARDLGNAGRRWVAIGDWNYGEGSSREHAAMSPRYLGAAAIITRAFARIHESNLKKQGVLPFTFGDASDYDAILEDDEVSILGLVDLAPGKPVAAIIHHADGSSTEMSLNHTLNAEQIEWFKNGSALNTLRRK